MLFEATVKIQLPGNNVADAEARLKAKVPHWPFEIVEIEAAAVQPPRVEGTGHIKLPLVGAHAR